MTLWRKNYIRLNNVQKLRLRWILIPWALRKIAGRKATSGSILVLVPKQGLWWQIFKSLYPAPGLSLTYSGAFLSQRSEFPWEILLTESLEHFDPKRAEQFLLRKQRDHRLSALLRLSADGPSQRGSSQSPPQGSSFLFQTHQERQENKAHCPEQFCFPGPWFVQSPQQEPQNVGHTDVSSPAVLFPVWAVVPGAALSRGYGGHKADEVIRSDDNRTLQRGRASNSTVPHGVTCTLWLWHGHLLILFSNLQHKLANQIVSLNSPLNKEASQCTGNKLYLTSTQFEDQKEVCLTLHYLHFLIFAGFCSSCYQTAQKTELIGKHWLLLREQKTLSHKQMGYSGDSQFSFSGLQMRSFHIRM